MACDLLDSMLSWWLPTCRTRTTAQLLGCDGAPAMPGSIHEHAVAQGQAAAVVADQTHLSVLHACAYHCSTSKHRQVGNTTSAMQAQQRLTRAMLYPDRKAASACAGHVSLMDPPSIIVRCWEHGTTCMA